MTQDAFYVMYDKEDRPYYIFEDLIELSEKLDFKVETAYQMFSRFIKTTESPVYAYDNGDGTETCSQMVFQYKPRGNNPRWQKGQYRGYSIYKFWNRKSKQEGR